MRRPSRSPSHKSQLVGIECGGTHSRVLICDRHGVRRRQLDFGPGNLQLISDQDLADRFRLIHADADAPAAVSLAMAGLRSDRDHERALRLLRQQWPEAVLSTHHDLHAAWAAAGPADQPRIVAVSGTGSCVYGVDLKGNRVKVGGWGHLLGDGGSGYHIAHGALKQLVENFDASGKLSHPQRRLLSRLQMNHPDELVPWMLNAPKSEVAALAELVFAAAGRRDRSARNLIREAAFALADQIKVCAHKLPTTRAGFELVFAGSTLCRQPGFARQVEKLVRQQFPRVRSSTLQRDTVWGTIEIAKQLLASRDGPWPPTVAPNGSVTLEPANKSSPASSTEDRHPDSMNLDRLPLEQAIKLMLKEDAALPAAIQTEARHIKQTIRLVLRALRAGGRLFYVGAGTSGRLGVLDASECPPTFRIDPEQVQGIIAGGQSALWSAVEGAEDDPGAGAGAMGIRGVGKHDFVLGIAASGRTPFVHGALREAGRRGAKTGLLHFNTRLGLARDLKPDVIICPKIGPEILTGSTRLKAGTATKLILNLISTLTMVRLGKVAGNLMVDLNPSNTKLRDRATRIVSELTGAENAAARAALGECGWVVKNALRRLGGRSRGKRS